MSFEPPLTKVGRNGSPTKNPYEGRWGWWYSAIADHMIRSPGCTLEEIAKSLNKAPNTISMIKNTDSFKDYFAMRRAEYTEDHDHAVRTKLTKVTELALDAMAEHIEQKRDKIDLPLLTDVMKSGLDRLGFAPKVGPAVVIDQRQDNRSVVLPGSVSLSTLEEARFALRVSQEQNRDRISQRQVGGLGGEKGAEQRTLEGPLGSMGPVPHRTDQTSCVESPEVVNAHPAADSQ